jgi:hypothetical protein
MDVAWSRCSIEGAINKPVDATTAQMLQTHSHFERVDRSANDLGSTHWTRRIINLERGFSPRLELLTFCALTDLGAAWNQWNPNGFS